MERWLGEGFDLSLQDWQAKKQEILQKEPEEYIEKEVARKYRKYFVSIEERPTRGQMTFTQLDEYYKSVTGLSDQWKPDGEQMTLAQLDEYCEKVASHAAQITSAQLNELCNRVTRFRNQWSEEEKSELRYASLFTKVKTKIYDRLSSAAAPAATVASAAAATHTE